MHTAQHMHIIFTIPTVLNKKRPDQTPLSDDQTRSCLDSETLTSEDISMQREKKRQKKEKEKERKGKERTSKTRPLVMISRYCAVV